MPQSKLLPALLFAAVPLGFLIGLAAFQLTLAIPDARHARAETIAGFEGLRAVHAVDEAVQDGPDPASSGVRLPSRS
jgi:hypothetical protein